MDKNVWEAGMMGLVVGDALGLPVQFKNRDDIRKNPVTKMIGFGSFNLPEGSWSDDSSMALATLESIRRTGEIDLKDIMNNFMDWLFKGQFTPYGRAYDVGITCDYAISKYKLERDVSSCGKTGERANGNGGLMRIMPACLFAYEAEEKGEYTEDEAIKMLHDVTALTHNHIRAHIATGIYYFMIKAILDEEGNIIDRLQLGVDKAIRYYEKDENSLEELAYYKRLYAIKDFAEVSEEKIKSSGYVVDSLEAAVWCLITTNSFFECLLKAVNLGDDSDTVGAIVGGLAALHYGYDEIPKDWLDVIVKRDWIERLI